MRNNVFKIQLSPTGQECREPDMLYMMAQVAKGDEPVEPLYPIALVIFPNLVTVEPGIAGPTNAAAPAILSVNLLAQLIPVGPGHHLSEVRVPGRAGNQLDCQFEITELSHVIKRGRRPHAAPPPGALEG